MTTEALHLRGVRLPDETHVDLWIRDGRVTYERVPGARTVAEGWILPGLVDMHCHVGLDTHGPVGPDVTERQAITERDAGVLLLRDAGSPGDTRWVDDRADLPRIIRAGRHVARPRRYQRNFAVEIEPHELTATVVAEAARGDGWVKIVGDWIDREVGDMTPLWPVERLTEAVAAAHRAGVRATTHVFGRQALADALAAGFDCVEHGTGLDEELIATMAHRGTALVPTLLNVAENFPGIADSGQAKFPAYAAHMRRLWSGAGDRVRSAYEAGVPIYVGTDAGGAIEHGRLADEVGALVRAGLPAEYVVGGASWRAREYLGRPGLAEGEPADLVVVATDPRRDPDTLRDPLRVVLRGAVTR
ncbi:MAG TPA: amidohydrolase family protein [Sporichthyaceae bacterium]|nr:amidohydrolase family protein [Sporichthyaceae bacterium]